MQTSERSSKQVQLTQIQLEPIKFTSVINLLPRAFSSLYPGGNQESVWVLLSTIGTLGAH